MTKMEGSAGHEIKRAKLDVKSTSDFSSSKVYDVQYNQMYTLRLKTLRPILLQNVQSKWPGVTFVDKVLDVENGARCYVLGTVYVENTLKPSVLDEVSQEKLLVPLAPKARYSSGKETHLLEDDSGRIKLTGPLLSSHVLVTGMEVAVLGTQQVGGEIEVEDIAHPGMPPQRSLSAVSEDKYVALVSGLKVGGKGSNPLGMQLMVDFLTGQLGSVEDEKEAAQVGHVIFVGNSLSDEIEIKDPQKNQKFRGKSGQFANSTEYLNQLDDVLYELSTHMTVDMMPGESDPANYSLPQKAMFRGMFPRASTLGSFSTVSNPHCFIIETASFCGTSGQPVDDIYRYSKEDDKLTLMENTLKWRHMAPTAPDTLACSPMKDSDPFIFHECPHVYFSGNQDRFAVRKIKGPEGQAVTLILVPSFADTATIALVNLRTLDARAVSFKTWTA